MEVKEFCFLPREILFPARGLKRKMADFFLLVSSGGSCLITFVTLSREIQLLHFRQRERVREREREGAENPRKHAKQRRQKTRKIAANIRALGHQLFCFENKILFDLYYIFTCCIIFCTCLLKLLILLNKELILISSWVSSDNIRILKKKTLQK